MRKTGRTACLCMPAVSCRCFRKKKESSSQSFLRNWRKRPVKEIIEYLQSYQGRTLKLMEVCGTHTAEISRNGIPGLLSPSIQLVSGPGCPVCVTPPELMDAALELASRPASPWRATATCSASPARGAGRPGAQAGARRLGRAGVLAHGRRGAGKKAPGARGGLPGGRF